MAKIYGLNGALRGKQGNNVFSVQNGTQVVKAYQPVVSNPRTIGQREQRAKLALAGKMSGATPALAISGLQGGNLRSKRARFVSNILRNATTTGDAASLVASIGLADVLYSEGSVGQWRDGMALSAVWGQGSIGLDKITVTFTPGTLLQNAPAGYGELRVVALYDAQSSTLEEVQVKEVGNTNLIFYFREAGRRDVIIAGYIVPFVRTTERANPLASGLYGSETTANLNVTSNQLLSGADFGRSLFFGVATLQGVTTSIAPDPGDDRAVVEEKKKK